MSDFTPRVVRRPGFDAVYGIIDLTARQVEIVMGALAVLTMNNEKVADDGYALYSDLFDSVEYHNENKRGMNPPIELNPYVIGTATGKDPTEALRVLIEAVKAGNAS